MSETSRQYLPWQAGTWERLQGALAKESLPHGLLLSGTQSSGKVNFARAFAAYLMCQDPAPDSACGQCRSCELLAAGSHPDFKEITPLEDSRVIRIDQVRELIDFANKTSSLGSRKVILLHPAEVMNTNAANALLKCLEEPAQGTHLVLVSHRASALSATIRSRCQSQLMAAPSMDEALDWLSGICGDPGEAKELLQAASGRVMAAAELRGSEELAQRQALQKGLQALVDGKLPPVQFPALLPDLELGEVIDGIMHFLEARLRSESARGQSLTPEPFILLDELGKLQRSVLKGGNPNRQLTLEDTAIRLRQVL